ncbi:hypothetical protein YB2330_001889 [Saitoella coloradoensis]
MEDDDLYNTYFALDPNLPYYYPKSTILDVRHRRDTLDGKLFFDLLLAEVAELSNASKLYPPKNTGELRDLYNAILTSEKLDLLKKHSFYYYILKDWNAETEFARAMLIPPHWCRLMDAYWYLDQMDFPLALINLSAPSLNPNFSDKIVTTLAVHAPPVVAVTFVQVAEPALENTDVIKAYMSALSRTSVEAAFAYQRTLPPDLRETLFADLLHLCLEYKSGASLAQLVRLPLDAIEEDILTKTYSQSASELAKETLLVWYLHRGKTNEALAMAKSKSKSATTGLGGMKDELERGMYKSMLQVQRKLPGNH